MTRVALLRCGRLPSFVTWEVPNLEELFEEDHLLLRGLERQGFQASAVVWNHPDVDWDQFDVAFIRSTWDYLDDVGHFLQVMSSIDASACRLYNPLAAISWNIDKHYLFDLEKWGINVIPTYRASEIEPGLLQQQFADWQVQSVILKPSVGLGGSGSSRVPLDHLGSKLGAIQADQPHLEYLVQPFVESVVSEGEWSFIYFGGQLSHVLLKKPAPGDYRVQGIYGGTVQPVEPAADDFLQAAAVMARIPLDLLYARLDFVRIAGQLCVMEVELIEPIFSFNLVPASIGRLAAALHTRLAST